MEKLYIDKIYRHMKINDLPFKVKENLNIDGLIFKALEQKGIEEPLFSQMMNELLAGRIFELEEILDVQYEPLKSSEIPKNFILNYVNGFAKEEFLQHMYEELPSVFNTAFSREMLENIVDYGVNNYTTSKNGLYYFLTDVIPQLEPNDLIPYISKELLTDEVLCLAPRQDLSVDELISNATHSCEDMNKDVVDRNTVEFVKE